MRAPHWRWSTIILTHNTPHQMVVRWCACECARVCVRVLRFIAFTRRVMPTREPHSNRKQFNRRNWTSTIFGWIQIKLGSLLIHFSEIYVNNCNRIGIFTSFAFERTDLTMLMRPLCPFFAVLWFAVLCGCGYCVLWFDSFLYTLCSTKPFQMDKQ